MLDLVAGVGQATCDDFGLVFSAPLEAGLPPWRAAVRRLPPALRLAIWLLLSGTEAAYRLGSRSLIAVAMHHLEGVTPLMMAALLGQRAPSRWRDDSSSVIPRRRCPEATQSSAAVSSSALSTR